MKRYEVIITDKAKEDIKAIYEYISNTLLEPEIALNQYEKIANAIYLLRKSRIE